MTTPHRIATGAAALLALLAAACQPQASAPVDLASLKTGEFEEMELDRGLSLPTAAFVDGEGETHTLEEFKGKVIVYNLWAEWCAPCVEEMPTLAALQKEFADKDVAVVPIAAGYPDSRDSARAKLKELVGDDLPFFYDAEFNVNAEAETGAFPTTIIYDRNGKEAARLQLPATWNSPAAIKLVQAVLDGAT